MKHISKKWAWIALVCLPLAALALTVYLCRRSYYDV